MEVASPLAFAPAAPGSKRSLACSPQLFDATNHGSLAEMEIGDDSMQPPVKRRRFHVSLEDPFSEQRFSSPSPFLSSYSSNHHHHKPLHSTTAGYSYSSALKRLRPELSAPVQQKDLTPIVEEQASIIESLKKDKSNLESSVNTLKSDNDRLSKENYILRKAVTIQQERQNQAENELKAAHKYRGDAEDQMKKLEQIIMTLRYHLRAQEQASFDNDFLHHRNPDVF